MSFVLYALFSLLIGIIICIFLISMVDRYRINLNYKYENMSTRYDIPENGSFTATYSNDQTKYTIFDTKGNEICKFNVDYQKERPVHEYVYPNHVSYIEVLPNFTSRDRLIDSALGSLNIAIIPIVLSIKETEVRVPIHLKITLTIREAAEYSNIGINKIDSMLKQPNCPFVLYVGTRKLVKRKEFEEYIRRELII